jgi:hypothetical protein
MSTVLLIVLILLLFGGIGFAPTYGYSRSWGWGPSGVMWVLIVILLLFFLFGGYFR